MTQAEARQAAMRPSTSCSPPPTASCASWRTRDCVVAGATPCSTPPRWCTSRTCVSSKSGALQFPDRVRFLVYAGRVMRSIIIDLVRQRQAERHGGDAVHVTLTGDVADRLGVPTGEATIVRVHEALAELEKVDQRMARVVELRYFGGLTDAEVAVALQVTDRTVRRDWQQARLFLAEALK